MEKTRVVILGCTGMLGGTLLDVLSKEPGISLTCTLRDKNYIGSLSSRYGNVNFEELDLAVTDGGLNALGSLRDNEWVINALGVIKPYIRDDNSREVRRAISVNALFPHILAGQTGKWGGKVIQIATDCVFSGRKGGYGESDPHDAEDVYGKTKSLGEVKSGNFYNIRCSIIGPETKTFSSLFEWFRKQPENSILKGYANHLWNGVTTIAFAKACAGIIKSKPQNLPMLAHMVPADSVSKYELLHIFKEYLKRSDLRIEKFETDVKCDRTLVTTQQRVNNTLWSLAGYERIPTIREMVAELCAKGA